MDGNRFDTITRRLSSVASRRHVLSGLGVATAGALVGREAAAAPKDTCKKRCNNTAKGERKACNSENGKAKNTCLKTVKEERAACRSNWVEDGV